MVFHAKISVESYGQKIFNLTACDVHWTKSKMSAWRRRFSVQQCRHATSDILLTLCHLAATKQIRYHIFNFNFLFRVFDFTFSIQPFSYWYTFIVIRYGKILNSAAWFFVHYNWYIFSSLHAFVNKQHWLYGREMPFNWPEIHCTHR